MDSNSTTNKIIFWGPNELLPFVPIFITDTIAIKSCYLSEKRLPLKSFLEIELTPDDVTFLWNSLLRISANPSIRESLLAKDVRKTIIPFLAEIQEKHVNCYLSIPTFGKESIPCNNISIQLGDILPTKGMQLVSKNLIFGNLYSFACYSIFGGNRKPCEVHFKQVTSSALDEGNLCCDVIRLRKEFTVKLDGVSERLNPCLLCGWKNNKCEGMCIYKQDNHECLFKYLETASTQEKKNKQADNDDIVLDLEALENSFDNEILKVEDK